MTGFTTSNESSFPVKVGPGLTYSGAGGLGWGDAFVAKVKADGTGLVYAGYIGGGSDDRTRRLLCACTGRERRGLALTSG